MGRYITSMRCDVIRRPRPCHINRHPKKAGPAGALFPRAFPRRFREKARGRRPFARANRSIRALGGARYVIRGCVRVTPDERAALPRGQKRIITGNGVKRTRDACVRAAPRASARSHA